MSGRILVAAWCAGVFGLTLQASPAGREAPSAKVAPLPPTVTVLKQTLALKSSASSPTEDLVAEYIPARETLDHWSLMLGVRIFRGKQAPAQAVQMKATEIQARRAGGDFLANSASFAKADFQVIDFTLSSPPVVEHNVMSFSKLRDGRLVSYQLARRYYEREPGAGVEEGLRTFMQEIPAKRDVFFAEIERVAGELVK